MEDPDQLLWSQATLGDLEVLVGTPDTVTAAYKEAIARAERDIERSILPSVGGPKWSERFYVMKAKVQTPPRIMPGELGPLPKGLDPFARCNLWLLNTALASGVSKVRFICLWNGGGGDGPGGTADMYNEVRKRTGRVQWIDTRTAW
jgi:hypothetical protein